MHHTRLTRFVLLACAGLLAGCAYAPGGHIGYRAESAPIDDLVDIRPITPGLVRAQRPAPSNADMRRLSDSLLADVEGYDYGIGKGDVLSITVYDHPELTIPAGGERSAAESGNVVHNDGTIYYPYVGRLQVVGLTVAEVRDIIARRLATYIADPQVEVQVAAFRSKKVLVTGEVNEPGRQPITNVPLTVLDAISQAGGLNDEASWHEVTLTRNGEEYRLSLYDMLYRGELQQNRLLQDGDVLHVPDNLGQHVFVMGEVGETVSLPMGRSRLSLTDALTRAGGMNENSANASGIFVIREAAAESEQLATVYQLDARNATAMMLGTRFQLEPNDVVYVTTTPLGRWNRIISQILPSVTAVYQVTRATRDVTELRDDI
ncbi:polysaccharide export protein Wza [Halomonas sp. MCCC 1A17488]|uniref:polysaccharide export protein n=1 Tax=unclassified Halomonas TaxID=2609666 RepID=UPI0018D202D5|nr:MULTISPECIES: polysaccharide export protein [unclassified Halomonas]MCE8014825.1 polysaccharide export protein Wza [Halomonas sp. MCCC 1A17488]MCG3238158.1 polysaccharide export protein Wza [Halomonas sp. MCCC 1A17488]QPP48074.1 polysaccharide biosynthesis/export family protein [Halomonas sp. SS10-MC5]